ncbi:MAG: energy-coupling factor transporter transmembrane component T [Coriobacteriales bacterium]|jgi:energy-coupling factor transport system permease protein
MRFDSYHPGINVIFFTAAIVFAAWWDHPYFIAISWACAAAYSVLLRQKKGLAFALGTISFSFVVMLLYAWIMHFGITYLLVLPDGNHLTLEALCCGLALGFRISAVFMWLECLLVIFSSDKVVYLLGRISPRLSLGLSVLLRFVPLTAGFAKRISLAQAGIGQGPGQGSFAARARHAAARISMTINWCFERLVQMSDSMRSRGSTLKGRTAFSLYRFDMRDRAYVIFLVAAIVICLCGCLLDQTAMQYDPELIMNRITPLSIVFYVAYAALLLSPLLLQLWGEARFSHQVGARFANPVQAQSADIATGRGGERA